MKIAMWSGPRNLSTAMMYAFAQRQDCAVIDEPFYAAYLKLTGLDHPMRDQILASQPTDPFRVVESLTGTNPSEMPLFYQKHMTQHMVDAVPRDWIRDVTNVFLIRHPARVVASYSAKRENPDLLDIGFKQQAELYEQALEFGQSPVVVDSADIRGDPGAMLRRLCEAIGIHFDAAMLSWPMGGQPCDGVWAEHWYNAVHQSNGFAGPEGPLPELTGISRELAEAAMPFYDHLYSARLQA